MGRGLKARHPQLMAVQNLGGRALAGERRCLRLRAVWLMLAFGAVGFR